MVVKADTSKKKTVRFISNGSLRKNQRITIKQARRKIGNKLDVKRVTEDAHKSELNNT